MPCISGGAHNITGLFPSSLQLGLATEPTSAGVVGTSIPAVTYDVYPNAPNRSTWRHTTPFGFPVVPPV